MPEADAIALLTTRELDVLRWLMEGLSRNELGALLHVSPNTVRTHVQSILRKLNVHSALNAVALARQAGLVSAREDDVTLSTAAHRIVRGRSSPAVLPS